MPANYEDHGGNKYYDRYDPLASGEGTPEDKRWDKLLFRGGTIVQASELNEIQSVQNEFTKRLGRAFFKEGDIISGCNLYQIKEDGTIFVNVLEGKLFIDGKIRHLAAQNYVRLDATGNESFGVVSDVVYITEGDDSDLRDPVEGFDNFNQPGAHRRRYDYTWKSWKTGADTTAITVYELLDGVTKTVNIGIQYGRLLETMARRTFDESGNYVVNPFATSIYDNPADATTLIAEITAGKAYVQGWEVGLGTNQRVTFEKARNTRTVSEEAITFQTGKTWTWPTVGTGASNHWTYIFELDNSNVKQINTVEAVVFRNQSYTKAAGLTTDVLTNTPVEDIYQVIADASVSYDSTRHKYIDVDSVYVDGVDWQQNGNAVEWLVNPGAITYYVSYGQRTNLTEAVRTKTRVTAQSVTRSANQVDFLVTPPGAAQRDGIEVVRITDSALGTTATWLENNDYKFITGRNPVDDEGTNKFYYGHNPELQIAPIIIDWSRQGGDPGVGNTYYVTYDYWAHSTEGDYVGADSYSDYEDIDRIYPASTNFTNTFLRDTIDFRSFGLKGSSEHVALSKLDPVPGENFLVTYEHYIGRIDLVYMDSGGSIHVKAGSPGDDPIPPDIPDGVLAISFLRIDPYTESADDDVDVMLIPNRRYKMNDIENLEDRIKRLEYFQGTQILEDNALGQYTLGEKKGIFTDTFVGSRQSDLNYDDGTRTYEVSVDPTEETLRLGFKMASSPLTISSYTNASGTALGSGVYDFWKNTYTLPVTEKTLFEQPYATGWDSVQPFEVFDARGELELTPESDFWVETARTAAKQINIDLTGDLGHRTVDLGIEWGSWRTIASGWNTTAFRSFNQESWRTDQRAGTRRTLVPETKDVNLGDRIVDIGWINKLRETSITGQAEGMRAGISSLEVSFAGDRMTVSASSAADVVGTAHEGDSAWYVDTATNTVRTDVNGFTAFTFTLPTNTYNVGEHEVRVGNPNSGKQDRTYATHQWEGRGMKATKQATHAKVTNMRIRSQPVVQQNTTRRNWWVQPARPRRVSTCFLEGTMISIKRNDRMFSVPIENVKIGDLVKGFDVTHETSNSDLYGVVTNIESPRRENLHRVTFENGKELNLTWEHPIYTEYGWKSINPEAFWWEGYSANPDDCNPGKLGVGDRVFNEDGSFYKITKIEELKGEFQTHNLVGIRPSRTYFADGFLAHNRGGDPIAQTFKTPQHDRIILSSVDLFFKDKDDDEQLLLQLRNVVNGYPGPEIITWCTVRPGSVTTSDDGSSATNFRFRDPAILEPDTEYCLVLYSRSPNYNVFFGELGETDLNTGVQVTSNPFTGVYFRSANNSAWQADGFKDLKFKIYRCNFDNETHPCLIAFTNITGLQAGYLSPHITSVEPELTKIDWTYSTDAGSTYKNCIALDDIDFSTVKTQFLLRGQFRTDDDYLSPMIHKDKIGIITILFKGDGNYFSKDITLDSTAENVDIYVDEYLPSSTTINLYYSPDDGVTWFSLALDQRTGVWIGGETGGITEIDDDDNWEEYHYFGDLTGRVGKKYKIRIELQTDNKAISPKCKRLRAIFS